uniref:DUF6737 domain-containing protein n=1 Tax=Tetradesmus obliquus TaxID=3088 RepID=A0A383WGY0_TETOB|eukprot:jgi/Sobl393_1/18697/SZX75976.1
MQVFRASTGSRHLKHQQQSLRLAGNSRSPTLRPCRAYQQSQASNALQQSAQLSQQQQQQDSLQEAEQQAFDAERHQHIVEDYDLTYWHYQPWWLQPQMVIGSGIAFLVASLILDDEPTLKTAVLAAGPVALYWGIFLFLLPRSFKKFAVNYIEQHPEVEEPQFQQEQLQQQQQHQQQQQEQQQQQQQQ